MPYDVDVCIYGGTAAGVMAAVQVRSLGRSVLLIAPDKRLGGMTSGGLGWTDTGNKDAIGGLARRFYERVHAHYRQKSAWTCQNAIAYENTVANFLVDFTSRYLKRPIQSDGARPSRIDDSTMWTFEPKVAEGVFEAFVRENDVEVLRGDFLARPGGAVRFGPKIQSVKLCSGTRIFARVFIDASYEGDLLAEARVPFRTGREANAEFGESLNGIQPGRALVHQFATGVDPYCVIGQPTSGLLPGIAAGIGADGTGDQRIQAYNYRACFTDNSANQLPFLQPAGYHESRYELLFRNFEAGFDVVPWLNAPIPNRKTDCNNFGGFSSDLIGGNYEYWEASYEKREDIRRTHLVHQQGLMWALANHYRVPRFIRDEVAAWGVAADEFVESGGWPEQLYVREARRMIGAQTMTEHHCVGAVPAKTPVGLGAYTMDSHHTQRYVSSDGHIRNEGDVQVRVPKPYGIEFDAITPRVSDCTNLLVPVCLAATHIAYGSIRMEPVFMVLGQSAATAAVHAIDEGVSVQNIDRPRLLEGLNSDGQVLTWQP